MLTTDASPGTKESQQEPFLSPAPPSASTQSHLQKAALPQHWLPSLLTPAPHPYTLVVLPFSVKLTSVPG